MSSDETLVEQLNEGRVEALDELYRRHASALYVFCTRVLSASNPEDLVHDAFTRVVERSRQFDAERGSFRTWLFQIARNRGRDLARRSGKLRMLSLDSQGATDGGGGESEVLPGANSDDELLRAAIREAIQACLDELPHAEEKEAVVLYYLQGKVYREIGIIIGKSTSLVHKRISSARERLKRCLDRKGVGA